MTTWKRKEIKEKGKNTFRANFWKCVATALILVIVGGGTAGAFGGGGNAFSHRDEESAGHSINMVNEDWNFSFDADMNDDEGNISIGIGPSGEQDESAEEITEAQEESEVIDIPAEAMVAFVVVMAVAALFIFAVALVIDAFIANPLELGCKRFFRRNLDEPAAMSNIAFAFDSNYKNICKTMFLRDVYIVLWSLLFVIPGIIKSYEYKMIPYILSENPEMTTEQAFAESKKLMTGNKWKAFVLDLSFILWDIASAATCGLLGLFWVAPYKASTQAALYEAIKYGTTTDAQAVNA
ncbi:MAG: DUF975 family protein [Clostridiales bacterium]|nr:DUF975 family protein [Clostridiales bacterium]MBP3810329.1 DUF975 family protein [Clostridiales bacterium]